MIVIFIQFCFANKTEFHFCFGSVESAENKWTRLEMINNVQGSMYTSATADTIGPWVLKYVHLRSFKSSRYALTK